MDRGNTKQEILEASLELFSVQGFEATSVSQIAGAVGIRKASLYSHFENKQAILDALVKEVLEQYEAHSIFAKADQEKDAGDLPMTPDAAVQMIQGQIRYILHDPSISRARKMLVIEQFQNPELAKLQTKQNYSDVLQYFTGLIARLIQQGVLAEDDPEIMAAQFCLPISVWINLCDREPDREPEVMALVSRHIQQFFKVYQPKEQTVFFQELD
ncbi:TetR/AcrR family transcriptional regulator [Oscillibacter sp.]|uniref:TetR/AcrR family transcriptional regulator n=1 Tax=Oscillibacter sp. TaxID=1945593 RepID=UPI001B5601AB|nr:TetR/AcrR family transcriptional regulator [Oscillibacter sp.]MBP3509905.1 TetR/AcrR family transcriptional regulator [Oscillibacter sp.]